ncbi:MAG: SDR family oxidoreductase [Alphaproteobacteria bacterium]|nr:SDR family oxidoreductase [Alphaproteobacteria bacterium]
MRNVILIIGASSGIGLSTAQKLAEDEKNIVICSSRNIEQKPPFVGKQNIIFKNMDVVDEKSVCDLCDFIAEKYQNLDVIINCAGYVKPLGIFEISLEDWHKTLEVNLTGVFNVTKYGAALMKRNGGKIINVASTAGLTPRPGWAAYAAAKSGVINFSTTMSEELKIYGIRVYCICPGRTATPLRKILAPDEDPMTIMQPKAVAGVIKSLIDDCSNVLEGQAIIVRDRY